MIIFGSRGFVKTLAMLTLVCHSCHTPAAHRLIQRSRWFTLFFIPVIPMVFTRYTVCTFCGATFKVSKQDAQRLAASVQSPPAPPQLQPGPGMLPPQQMPPQQMQPGMMPPPPPGIQPPPRY